MSGIVSCIRENPSMPGLIAFGTYSKNVGLYKDGPLCNFKTASGVTQIEFSPCGTRLYSCCRKNEEFLCWDLRNPGMVLHSLRCRQADTNQRIHFDFSQEGKEVISGKHHFSDFNFLRFFKYFLVKSTSNFAFKNKHFSILPFKLFASVFPLTLLLKYPFTLENSRFR